MFYTFTKSGEVLSDCNMLVKILYAVFYSGTFLPLFDTEFLLCILKQFLSFVNVESLNFPLVRGMIHVIKSRSRRNLTIDACQLKKKKPV